MIFLTLINKDELKARNYDPVDKQALIKAQQILDDIKINGDVAILKYAKDFGEIKDDKKIYYTEIELKYELDKIDAETRSVLEYAKNNIERFAKAQKDSLKPMEIKIPGGVAGQNITPVEYAGCYAPGGRFPLPSSVLMTVIPAKVAGVKEVWVASPNPSSITLAAAAIAGANGLLRIGGAQAIGALAYGTKNTPACNVIVGPGNKYVTAAKKIVSGFVGIDMLAGPSELLVFCDNTANPKVVAVDLLAQAEHDVDAIPILITTDPLMVERVNKEIESVIGSFSTSKIMQESLKKGFAIVADNIEHGIELCDIIAPEHLELQLSDAEVISKKLTNYGALFIGSKTAEVFGDYCAGPNHTLPTGMTSKYTGGLSVFDFLRIRTWINIKDSDEAKTLIENTVSMAAFEGLSAHSESARIRMKS